MMIIQHIRKHEITFRKLTVKQKEIIQRSNKNGTMTNKKFQTTFKSFLTNKGNTSNDYVEKNGELISNEKELIELFNKTYANIIEISAGKILASIEYSDNRFSNKINLEQILKRYSSHPSILRVKKVHNHCKIICFTRS